MSDATSDERVRNRKLPRPLRQLQRNSGPFGLRDSTNSELHVRPADHAMRETADEKNRRKRRYHVTAESIGKQLVMAELLRRGFDAELAGSGYEKHDMLVRVRGSRPKLIQIKTVHSTPWYVRRATFAKRADQVTVYVVLGAEAATPARFFVVKNSDLAAQFRQPPTWKAFGFIDAKSVEKYDDNWDVLRLGSVNVSSN